MIVFIFSGFLVQLDRALAQWEDTKRIYPSFGEVLDGKGYLPAIDLEDVVKTYTRHLPTFNPYIYLAIGEAYRYMKKPEIASEYYRKAIEYSRDFGSLFLLERIFNSSGLDTWKERTRKKIIEILRKKGNEKFCLLSLFYENEGDSLIKLGMEEEGIRDYLFSHELDPYRRSLILKLAKVTFFRDKREGFNWLMRYFFSLFLFPNLPYLFHFSYRILILFLSLLSLSFILYFLSRNLPNLSVFLEEKTPLTRFMVSFLLLSLVVWLHPLLSLFVLIFLVFFFSPRSERGYLILPLSFVFLLPFLLSVDKTFEIEGSEGGRVHSIITLELEPYSPLVIDKRYEKDPVYLLAYGNSLKKEKRFEEALKIYRRGYNSSHAAHFYNNTGSIFYIWQEYDSAFYYYSKAAELAPHRAEPHFNLGLVYLKKLMFENARKEMKIATGIDYSLTEIQIKENPLPVDMGPGKGEVLRRLFSSFYIPSTIFNLSLFVFFLFPILIFALSFFFKSFEEKRCSLCLSPVFKKKRGIDDLEVCTRCYTKLIATKSKGIRERLKRKIRMKRRELFIWKALLLNLLLPGTGFYILEKKGRAVVYVFVFSLLLSAFLSKYLFLPEPFARPVPPYVGNLVLYIITGLFYIYLVHVTIWEGKKWLLKET